MQLRLRLLLGALVAIVTSGTASAQAFGAAASFSFDTNGNWLTVQLTNLTGTAGNPMTQRAQTLQAVLFDYTGGVNLDQSMSSSSVSLAAGSHTYKNSGSTWQMDDSIDLNQGWGLSHITPWYGCNWGISSAGLGYFSKSNFNGSNKNLKGTPYGIVGQYWDYSQNGSFNASASPLSQDSLVFKIHTPGLVDLDQIDKAVFIFGTGSDDLTSVTGTPGGGHHFVTSTPEPITSSLIAASALLFVRRKVRNRSAA